MRVDAASPKMTAVRCMKCLTEAKTAAGPGPDNAGTPLVRPRTDRFHSATGAAALKRGLSMNECAAGAISAPL